MCFRVTVKTVIVQYSVGYICFDSSQKSRQCGKFKHQLYSRTSRSHFSRHAVTKMSIGVGDGRAGGLVPPQKKSLKYLGQMLWCNIRAFSSFFGKYHVGLKFFIREFCFCSFPSSKVDWVPTLMKMSIQIDALLPLEWNESKTDKNHHSVQFWFQYC